MPNNYIRRPQPDPYQSPPTMASQKSAATPSSCASNDPETNEAEPSPCSKVKICGSTPKKP
ncbi:UNVERIFIED_CONTAM: hypothetical protein Sradi_5694200 [Sesamum radiatum]|uniref:Uncharacterized protein n=1 Tax=Sesamum radiatum TaxID=300843 RepID=A0AAW2L297_SESRA